MRKRKYGGGLWVNRVVGNADFTVKILFLYLFYSV